LQPWDFYEYNLYEYLQKRKGYQRRRKSDYQQMIIASMLPYMKKEERIRIVSQAFREEGAKVVSLRERYELLKNRYRTVEEPSALKSKNVK
jgi:hypothetical protein